MHPFLRRCTAAAAVVVLGLALVVIPAPALAANPLKLTVFPAQRCARANVTALAVVTFQLKSANGTIKDTVVEPAENDGSVAVCFAASIVVGDRVSIKVGSQTHVATVLRVGLDTPDRVTDGVAGGGPKGGKVRIVVHRCPMGNGCNFTSPIAFSRMVTVNSHGHWSTDLTGGFNLIAWNIVDARVTNSAHDVFIASRDVPSFDTGFGDPFIGGKMPPGGPFAFTLKHEGLLLATASLHGGLSDTFKDDASSQVDVSAGDLITGAFATDATMLVPDLDHHRRLGGQHLPQPVLPQPAVPDQHLRGGWRPHRGDGIGNRRRRRDRFLAAGHPLGRWSPHLVPDRSRRPDRLRQHRPLTLSPAFAASGSADHAPTEEPTAFAALDSRPARDSTADVHPPRPWGRGQSSAMTMRRSCDRNVTVADLSGLTTTP